MHSFVVKHLLVRVWRGQQRVILAGSQLPEVESVQPRLRRRRRLRVRVGVGVAVRVGAGVRVGSGLGIEAANAREKAARKALGGRVPGGGGAAPPAHLRRR